MSTLGPARSRWLLHAPRILFFVALAVLLAGVALQWPGGSRLARVQIVLYLGWLLSEVPVTFRGVTAMKESHTLVPYALARIATIAACVLPPAPATSPPLAVAGLALFVAGVAMRAVAIKTLGRFYTHHVARRTDQVAVTTGLYRFVRHPAYCGMLLAHVGLVVGFASPLSVWGLLMLFAAVIWRIRVEERALWDMPGYAEYATGKARLCPGVW